MGYLEEAKLLCFVRILFFVSLVCGTEVLVAEQVRDAVHSDTTQGASIGSPITLSEFGADFKGFEQGSTGNIEVDLWRLYKDAQNATKDLGAGGAKAIIPLAPDNSALQDLDFYTMRRRALSNPRVHDWRKRNCCAL